MVKVINALRYDTDTAELVCEYEFSRNGDFRHIYDALYRTESGKWFTCGYGGPLTKYAVPGENGWTNGSEDLQPVSDSEAYEFLEYHASADVIARYFSVQDA